jgi:hypothetical protein
LEAEKGGNLKFAKFFTPLFCLICGEKSRGKGIRESYFYLSQPFLIKSRNLEENWGSVWEKRIDLLLPKQKLTGRKEERIDQFPLKSVFFPSFYQKLNQKGDGKKFKKGGALFPF